MGGAKIASERILQIVFSMDRAGLETMLMNYYRWIDRDALQFDFLMHRSRRSDYDGEIGSLGGRIYRVPEISVWTLPCYLRSLDRFFTEHPEYHIVHSHLDALSAPVLRAAKRAGVPVRIAHSHNNGFELDKKYPVRMAAKQFIPLFSTHLWGCSEKALDFMFEQTAQKSQETMVIPNAIHLSAFSFDTAAREHVRSDLGLKGRTVIGQVGRFCYQKNQGFLLNILSKLCQKGENAVLLLIGAGKDEQKLRDQAARMGLADRTLFLGPQPELSKLYSAMDVFVLPSRFEGFGMVLLEAQANGLPCLCSDAVSPSSNVTGRVRRLSLAAGAEEWARETLQAIKNSPHRGAALDLAQNSEFEVSCAAKKLQERYLGLLDRL